ncbi:MAG: hypothetical protein LQ351_003860 [Letrouitia transgressa]|nr:MAG: hypothetical protein LQ351_003860 [Letrouitia transgressa]
MANAVNGVNVAASHSSCNDKNVATGTYAKAATRPASAMPDRERTMRDLAKNNPYINMYGSAQAHGNYNHAQGLYSGWAHGRNPSPAKNRYDLAEPYVPTQYANQSPLMSHHPQSLPSSGHQTPHPQLDPNNLPNVPPEGGFSDRQREARNFIVELEKTKKSILQERRIVWAQIESLNEEIEQLKESQQGMENLRFIYPKEAKLAELWSQHHGFGKAWDQTCDNLESTWAEMMVKDDEYGNAPDR